MVVCGGGDGCGNLWISWWLCSKVKVSRGIEPLSPNGLEPALPISEALADQYLHGS